MQQDFLTLGNIGSPTAERPTLLVGLAGFSAERRARLSDFVRRIGGPVAWDVSALPAADAWWLNGMHAQLLPDGSVRVPPGIPQERSMRLRWQDVDRPLAVAGPLNADVPQPERCFDMRDRSGMARALQEFAQALVPLAAQLALAASILAHEGELHAGLRHLIGNGRLLAVVDPRGDAGLATGVWPQEIAAATWSRARLQDSQVPAGFQRASIALLMWRYAMRSSRDLLPARYRVNPIHFRRPPRLSEELLTDAHVLVLRELLQAPATFDELRQQTGLPDAQLSRDLACLYFAGSVTTDPKRAASATPASPFESSTLSPYSGLNSRSDTDWVSLVSSRFARAMPQATTES